MGVGKAEERIALVFERGMKIPLQYEELVEICHGMICFLFPNIPVELQAAATDICDQEPPDAGLAPYMKRKINADWSQCGILQLTFPLLLSKSPSFYHKGKKVCRPVEHLRVVFRKKYLANTL